MPALRGRPLTSDQRPSRRRRREYDRTAVGHTQPYIVFWRQGIRGGNRERGRCPHDEIRGIPERAVGAGDGVAFLRKSPVFEFGWARMSVVSVPRLQIASAPLSSVPVRFSIVSPGPSSVIVAGSDVVNIWVFPSSAMP